MAAKKQAVKRTARTGSDAAKAEAGTPKSMPKEGKDPGGGLTSKGRAFFAKTEGAHLRPGVQGPADTPEKMVRKGSFLRRHFAHPRGPVKDAKGQPTRLALSAHAWGEPVPQTMADTKKLASKGHELLAQYHRMKDGETSQKPVRRSAGKAKKSAAKQAAAKQAAAERTGAVREAKRGVRAKTAKKSARKPAAR